VAPPIRGRVESFSPYFLVLESASIEVPSHVMHDIDYVIELAEAYGRAEITRNELQGKTVVLTGGPNAK
jgi:hypothetical protein